MTCPDCGSENTSEQIREGEFQFGRKNPVTLKATAPVFVCADCGYMVADWRMEKERSLAVSAYLKEKHDTSINPSRDLEIGHAACAHHRKQLEHAAVCGCFYCLGRFGVGEIAEWIDGGTTALCPRCGIDAVIPVAEEVTGTVFLKRMQQFWFDAAAVA
ncbi:MAG TPA: hypothetical protein VFW94_24115 [Candidatus Acidoferrales bacterium]|nr:hypothetical protein [Candidatus Acidoferrales bacterium]